MSLYVLDTDTLTLFKEGHAAVSGRVLGHGIEEIGTTILNVEEQLSGWYTQVRRARKPDKLAWAYKRLADNIRFLSRLQIVVFDEPSIARYEQLKTLKLKIGKFDLRIAATVLEVGATLVTRNRRDFAQIPDLVIEDWSQ